MGQAQLWDAGTVNTALRVVPAKSRPKRVSKAGKGTLTDGQLDALAVAAAAAPSINLIRRQAGRNPMFAQHEPWSVFAPTMRVLIPQSYGCRFERRFIAGYGWSAVGSREDRGDAKDSNGSYREIKVSLLTDSPKVNFVQIRLHQRVDLYDLFVVDPLNTLYHLELTKQQMADEIALCGGLAHGTGTTAIADTSREYSVRFDWKPGDAVYRRWTSKYLVRSTPLAVLRGCGIVE
jgi:hypothetical protein